MNDDTIIMPSKHSRLLGIARLGMGVTFLIFTIYPYNF